MTLTLSHDQRLNLFVLVGLPEVKTVLEAWPVWKLMDRLMLDEEEKRNIGFTEQVVNGQQAFGWEQSKSPPPREMEFNDSEIAQIQKAVYGMPRVSPGQMRGWLQPLLAQMPVPVESNGVGVK